MASKRLLFLSGTLMALVLWYVAKPAIEQVAPGWLPSLTERPLPGINAISGLQVHRDQKGKWIASFDYFYTGDPARASLVVVLPQRLATPTDPKPMTSGSGLGLALRGSHQVTTEIFRPTNVSAPVTTEEVVVQLRLDAQRVISSQQVAQSIDWPERQTWEFDRDFSSKSTDEVLKWAVRLIDTDDSASLAHAKLLLERLLVRDARFDPGYVELARIAMKTNWGPEGLHQAENLIASALQIRPGSVDAKILLGYVYTHQGKFSRAQALFAEASQTDTKNLWLWTDWGQLLAMQGKVDSAIEKYREAVSRPRTTNADARARHTAYSQFLALVEKRGDLDAVEALLKQRTEEFGPSSCYGVEQARFLLQHRGKVEGAMVLARQAVDANCTSRSAREVLGMAYYMAWAGPDGLRRDESLNQARIFLPMGARPLYLLASSARSVSVAQRLVAAGESIDQRDNDKLTALAYSLQLKDLPTARRLLKLGARPDVLVGATELPVALLPVMSADLDGIRLMQQHGIDYSKLRYQGMTAIDHARQIGDRRLLEVLDPGARRS